MTLRLFMIAATAMSAAAMVTAQPAQTTAGRESSPSTDRPAKVVLASVESVDRLPDAEAPPATPATDAQPPATPAKKRPRAARVTTCRCGDPG